MKKMLLLALVAIVAGSAFAATDPAFSGTFEFYNTWDFETKTQQVGSTSKAAIKLNGSVDEWSTVSAELGTATVKSAEEVLEINDADGNPTGATAVAGDYIVTTWDSYDDIKAGSKWVGKDIGDFADVTKTTAVTLNDFTMTTDITGALGVDGPVGVTVTWGKTYLQAAEYHGVAGYKDLELTNPTDSYVGFKLAISIIEKINLITAVYPTTYWGHSDVDNKSAVFGLDLQVVGLVEGLNFNFYYMLDPGKDNDGDAAGTQSTNEMGITAGYTGAMGLSAGLAWKYHMGGVTGSNYDPFMPFGVSVAYAADFGLTAGVAYTNGDFLAEDQDGKNAVSVNLTYKIVADTLDVFAAAKFPFSSTFADDFGIEGGVKAYLGGVTYILGYEHHQVNFGSPNGDDSTGLFFTVKAAF